INQLKFNSNIELLENIEIQFVFAENEVQFEEKLKIFLSHVLKEFASPHEIVQKRAIEILNHIKKRMTKAVKLPWDLLAELVCSENFMRFTLVKNFTIVFLKMAYDRLTEKDKITNLLPLIKNIELRSHKSSCLVGFGAVIGVVIGWSRRCPIKKLYPNFVQISSKFRLVSSLIPLSVGAAVVVVALSRCIASPLVSSSLHCYVLMFRSCWCRIIDVSVGNVVADRVINGWFVAIFVNVIFGVGEKESLCQSQSLKLEIMCYLCKSKLAANTFPFMLHVSFDCLYSPKTDENLQKKGEDFIQWITRKADSSILELIGKALLFGLLKIIKKTKIEKFNNLMKEQEINQKLLFKPFYGSPNLSIDNSEEDNEILKVIVIKFHEIDQLDQFNQWTNEENVQEIIKILEENNDEFSSAEGKMSIAINDNSKLSIVLNQANYSKEIYADQFYSFTTSQSNINQLENNEDLLIINSKEFISENSDKSTHYS
ncbi:15292_t:CDS:10, partial [Gigaspora margarita]